MNVNSSKIFMNEKFNYHMVDARIGNLPETCGHIISLDIILMTLNPLKFKMQDDIVVSL